MKTRKRGDRRRRRRRRSQKSVNELAFEIEKSSIMRTGSAPIPLRTRFSATLALTNPQWIPRYRISLVVIMEANVSFSQIYMTPSDFLRSITPGVKQPDGLGLDQFKKFDPATMKTSSLLNTEDIDETSIFHHLGCSGLISFSDYIFLLTILSTSK